MNDPLRSMVLTRLLWLVLVVTTLCGCQTGQPMSSPPAPDSAPRVRLPLKPANSDDIGCAAVNESSFQGETRHGRSDE